MRSPHDFEIINETAGYFVRFLIINYNKFSQITILNNKAKTLHRWKRFSDSIFGGSRSLDAS